MSTLLLAGGGTGGHVYPALAMGDALRLRGHEVLYYGDGARLEGRVAPQRGYRFRAVPAVPYPRAGVVAKLRFLLDLLGATLAARRMLQEDRVALVLGVGGYVMAPSVFAAWTLGIPAILHESNVAPGLANRACARVARKVLLTYPDTRAHLPSVPTAVVGCPVNLKVLAGSRAEAAARYGLREDLPTLLVVGGSLGAATINDLARAVVRAGDGGFQVVHVTGPRYYEEQKSNYGPLPAWVHLRDYEDQMGQAFALADLVVCRAGSSTLAELCAVGKPSVLVPSPNVTDNHQEANARGLEKEGAARVYVEKGMDRDAVAAELVRLLHAPEELRGMAEAARRLARLDVPEVVAAEVEAVLAAVRGAGAG